MASEKLNPPSRVILLPLNDIGEPDLVGSYIYLPPPTNPPYVLRFTIDGTSSICREGTLWVNFPAEGKEFQRENYRPFKLTPNFNRTINIDIAIHKAGAYAFYTTYSPLPPFSERPQPRPQPEQTPTHYIDVSPKLELNGEPLPLDALSVFSILSKQMGKYPTNWEAHLRGIGEREYNFVHFTPLMHRGESNSPYSIYDQLAFDPNVFAKGEQDIAELVANMEKKNGLLSMTDVVWNHTANNSTWLEDHPEAGYNVSTAPWLESAVKLDDALLQFSNELEERGLPTVISTIPDLVKCMKYIKENIFRKIRLWEYYVIAVERNAEAVTEAWKNGEVRFPKGGFGVTGHGGVPEIDVVRNWTLKEKAAFLIERGLTPESNRLGGRFHRSIDPPIGAALVEVLYGKFGKRGTSATAVKNEVTKIMDEVNLPFYKEYDSERDEILEQIFNRAKYIHVDEHGPRQSKITRSNPFVESYFTRLPLNERTEKHGPDSLALANNGWIWNANPLVDFAGETSRAYLRREVIVWGDCVKMRYGKKPDDNPYLWDRMAKYTRLMAKHFHGFRIDNCHSTPLPLAEYLLDEARRVRPDLYVCAELFTGSEAMDYLFVERLGISCLIREAMQAWGAGELSRLVHRHGGIPIGSFDVDEVTEGEFHEGSTGQPNGNPPSKHEIVTRVKDSPVHALFMDCTHDNEMPAQKRDARDTLPNSALVAMCACATGSVFGYDEIYPRLIDLVNDTRRYTSPYSENTSSIDDHVGGIGGIKKLLNGIHTLMGKEGYDESHVHHEGEYVTVHRVHPKTRKGYFLIAHTAFPGGEEGRGKFNPVHLTGTKAKLLGSWSLEVDVGEDTKKAVQNDKKELKGLPSTLKNLEGIRLDEQENETIVTIPDTFPPGSIALMKTWIPGAEKHAESLDSFLTSGANEAFAKVNLFDLNYLLYRCDAEERDSSGGKDGVYDIPNSGPLVYAGLQGWWSILRDVVKKNDLGHPLCQHLRSGQWALDYIVHRMERLSAESHAHSVETPCKWIRERFTAIRRIPSFLLPRYFALVIRTAYNAAWNRALQLMGQNVRDGHEFLQSLAMVSVQQTGYMKSASLYPKEQVPCLAAGLPHFATDWARCWGRDIFISLRGLFLGTGRFEDAKDHILAFASVLKHGMIPNLLDSGRRPRYNARDSIWFFLQNIQDYTKIAPNGIEILQEKVKRRFLPFDDRFFEVDDPRAYSKTSTIEEIIQEALQRHAHGISFREANAGPSLDMQMKSEGFDIDVRTDWETGLVFGGSQFNCGTWMDKMGESDQAGSKGVPGTPRDGAAVEITGLLYSTVSWVAGLHKQGKYKWSGVSRGGNGDDAISFGDWASLIQKNFERCHYIPVDKKEDGWYDINAKVVNRRGIYKDLYKSGKEYEDYQLRPNFTIAMVVAPQLFTPEKALHALAIADRLIIPKSKGESPGLRGPTGMATLDPKDLNYRPYYNNSEDSSDFATSKGRNYHQGPEWLWPTGFFLRALLRFDLMRRKTNGERMETYQLITQRLEGCRKAIKESPWAGLTELTNKNGEFCADSSPTQAWSAGCLIDLFQDAYELTVEGELIWGENSGKTP